jgi:hypothetical protein
MVSVAGFPSAGPLMLMICSSMAEAYTNLLEQMLSPLLISQGAGRRGYLAKDARMVRVCGKAIRTRDRGFRDLCLHKIL